MEPIVRVAVNVTFLRMDRPPAEAAPSLPPGFQLVRVTAPTVGFYRYLYNTVGADYVWWLRRTLPDADLAALLGDPAVSIYVLYANGEPGGFFELDVSNTSTTAVSLFFRPYLLDPTDNTIHCTGCYLQILTPTLSVASAFGHPNPLPWAPE